MNWSHLHTLKHLGTVLEVSGSQKAGDWLAAPSGLYRYSADGGRWQPVQKEIPFWYVNTVSVHGSTVLAAGLPKGIVRSGNGGRSWEMSWVEQTQLPITIIRPSPNVGSDRVWLAGTRGDGVLRSTDDGRHWELANWGLHDFTILDLATAPAWGEREFLFAVTLDGVYQSPNGGRAWRNVWSEWEGEAPLACAVSANFETDQTVWVGTESGSLFISRDRGRTFARASQSFDMINTLFALEDGDLLVGTGQTGLVRLTNPAANTASTTMPTQPDRDGESQQIFRVTKGSHHHYTALLNGGIWSSKENGSNWQEVDGLNAGRFVWLHAHETGLLAGGPETGLWQIESEDVTSVELGPEPILAAGFLETDLIVCQPGKLSIGAKSIHEESSPNFVRLTTIQETFWAVDPQGSLWKGDRQALEKIPFPPGISISALAGGTVESEKQVAVAAFNPRQKEIAVIVWKPAESKWHPIGKMVSRDGRAQLTWDRHGDLWLAVGKRIRRYRLADGEHTSHEIGHESTPVIALKTGTKASETLVAAATVEDVALFEEKTGAWKMIRFVPQEPIADIVLQNESLFVMTVDGRIWRLEDNL